MKSYSTLIKQALAGTILMGLTSVNAVAADMTTTTTTTAAPVGAAISTPAAKTATPPVNPANVDNNAELQKCIDGVPRGANGAPDGNDMVACTQKYGHPTNIAPMHKP
jgi:hypothetical protein